MFFFLFFSLVYNSDLRKPVEVGSMLYFNSQICYTQDNFVQTRVSAEVRGITREGRRGGGEDFLVRYDKCIQYFVMFDTIF